MPIAILPDVDEQRCIGCALCVEICTSLGPDVLRVKPVDGWHALEFAQQKQSSG